jgi:hypothetical protein
MFCSSATWVRISQHDRNWDSPCRLLKADYAPFQRGRKGCKGCNELRGCAEPLFRACAPVGTLRSRATDNITVVCRTERRSAAAEAILRSAGFENVAALRGGMERWNVLGFEIIRNDVSGTASTAKGHQP